jgi:tetratricopeptide (TPR) repeat protein
MPTFSPICICPYRRLEHLQKTVDALKKNPEAIYSDLFFFSDAPAPGDERDVAAVRRYLRTITGFRRVEIIEREMNNRVANWVDGEMQLLNEYGRVISLEDDLIVAPSFLRFLNDGLERFKDDERIFAICGYTPPMRFEWITRENAILSPRYSGWGYGYWKRSLERIPRRIEDYPHTSQSPAFRKHLEMQGDDLAQMLQRELAGSLDAGDVRMNYIMARDDLRVVCPTVSLVHNIGFDDTGTHCPSTRRFDADLRRVPTGMPIPYSLTDDPLVFEMLRRFRCSTWRTEPWRDDEIITTIDEIQQTLEPKRHAARLADTLPVEHAHKLGKGIVFLLGLPRSGTTLLQRLLGEHPEIHTTAEPWLLLPVSTLLSPRLVTADYDTVLAAQGVEEFTLELPGGKATLLDGLRQFVADLYRQCRTASGASYFLDKTPRYHYIVPELRQLFPLAKFVVLLRNPLGVLASVAESWFNGSVEHALASPHHQRDLTRGFEHLAQALPLLGHQAHTLQYETLVKQPETELRKLCDFLEVDFTPAMLRYDPTQHFKGAFGDNIGIPQHDAASPASVDKWQDVLFRPENILAAKAFLAATSPQILAQFGQDSQNLQAQFENAILERVLQGALPFDALAPSQTLALADEACDKGEQAIEAEEFDEAAEHFETALSLVPNHTRTQNNIGVLWWINQQPEHALSFFASAHQNDPNDRTSLLNFTAALTVQGHIEQARHVYFGYMMSHPEDHEVAGLYLSLDEKQPSTPPPPPAPSKTARAQVRADDFSDYTISRVRHFTRLGLPPMHAGANIEDCDLKVYQDMLTYWFILDNFPPGARLLEIGGGNSRIIQALKGQYEFWNLDKFEGLGAGPTDASNTAGHTLVRAYIGDFSPELADNTFDGVFSISTLEHTPQDDATHGRIADDIDRILKPGGLSMHCIDVVLHRQAFIHPLIPYLHAHRPTLNPAVPLWALRLDPDLWHMSKAAYTRQWQPITQKTYEAFGRPASYNLVWRKPAAT